MLLRGEEGGEMLLKLHSTYLKHLNSVACMFLSYMYM